MITNTRGDVIETRNGDGNVNAKFVYDAWGKLMSVTDGAGNALPETSFAYQISLKYRGYVYDVETGLYYLQSRYYDPNTGRFLNSDDVDYVGNGILNLFTYSEHTYIVPNVPPGSSNSFIINVIQGVLKSFCSLFTVKYKVPLYYQENTRLCWAFCQTMIEDYKAGIVRTQDEAYEAAKELAIEVNGRSNWNRGAWPTNCAKYYLNGAPRPEFVDIYSIYSLYELLIEHGPLYAWYYNEDDNRSHLVVVTGVDLINNIVYTNNPWGIAGEQSFQQFCNGFAGGTGNGSYPLNYYFVTK